MDPQVFMAQILNLGKENKTLCLPSMKKIRFFNFCLFCFCVLFCFVLFFVCLKGLWFGIQTYNFCRTCLHSWTCLHSFHSFIRQKQIQARTKELCLLSSDDCHGGKKSCAALGNYNFCCFSFSVLKFIYFSLISKPF